MKALLIAGVVLVFYVKPANAQVDWLLHAVENSPQLEKFKAFESLDSNKKRETFCLALNVYWEARGEPLEGQVGVAAVSVNRLHDPHFPKTLCNVVFETRSVFSIGRHGAKKRKDVPQFSWTDRELADMVPTNAKSWNNALMIATAFDLPGNIDNTNGSLYYHNKNIAPVWSANMQVKAVIGAHKYF